MNTLQIELGDTATSHTPYVTDLTEVEVRKCGANLFPFGESVTVKGRHRNGVHDDFIPSQTDVAFLRGKRITYSAYYDLSGAIEETTTASTNIYFYDADGNTVGYALGEPLKKSNGVTQGYARVSETVPQNTSKITFVVTVFFNGTQAPDANSFVTVSQGMVTLGNELKEYEPYTETTYTANADGTVEGVKSISPNMTLIPNSNGVLMDVTYNADTKMYIDNKFTELQALILEG